MNPFYARVPGSSRRRWRFSRSEPAAATASSNTAVTWRPSALSFVMGSGGETARETVAALSDRGERVGVVQVRLYRPFPARRSRRGAARACGAIAVLDRTKEPGSVGEPLFLDTVAAVTEAFADGELEVMPRIVGGRYGLSSKEFTPAWSPAFFDELKSRAPATPLHDRHQRRRLGNEPRLRRDARHRAARHGPRDLLRPRLGRDRRANKNTIKILGSEEAACAGLFRLRLEEVRLADRVPLALRAPADPGPLPRPRGGLCRLPSVRPSRPCGRARRSGAPAQRCCSTARHPPEDVWSALSRPVQEQILAKHIDLHVVDAGRIAREAGLPGRINIVLQTCFFALSGVVPREQAIERIKTGDREDVRPARGRGCRT